MHFAVTTIHQGHTSPSSKSSHEKVNREVDHLAHDLLLKHRSSFKPCVSLDTDLAGPAPGSSHQSSKGTSSSASSRPSPLKDTNAGPNSAERRVRNYCSDLGLTKPSVHSQPIDNSSEWMSTVTIDTSGVHGVLKISRTAGSKQEARRLCFASVWSKLAELNIIASSD